MGILEVGIGSGFLGRIGRAIRVDGYQIYIIAARPAWKLMVQAVEQVTGRRWKEMTAIYGDPGRDGLLAVATRHLGWRLTEVVREIPGLVLRCGSTGHPKILRALCGSRGTPGRRRGVAEASVNTAGLTPLRGSPLRGPLLSMASFLRPAGELRPTER